MNYIEKTMPEAADEIERLTAQRDELPDDLR